MQHTTNLKSIDLDNEKGRNVFTPHKHALTVTVHLQVKDVIFHLRFFCFHRFYGIVHILFWYYIFHWCFLEKLQHDGLKSASMATELPPISQLRNSLACSLQFASGAQLENAVGPNHL
ncbi:hypothetical protein E2C01_044375 [Portunus trituberculatus]|uniref:Uncharacterized protein n=1 Tax=Portunus trituberculatus TaxID=210409 RepID=A0A5B7FYA3_PORTR|nr:hypothetical protein [Portunus trituberculatus]